MQSAISLYRLNAIIKSTLDAHLDPAYWVTAEIGEFRDSMRGHVYLDLIEKEEEQITAKLRANIWSYTYQGIRQKFTSQTGENLRGGLKILALVSVQFHELYGLSLNVKDIDPSYTIGERARKRQEVIDRLTKEGLLNLNKQFELPLVPQRIAVISSKTAAGYGDFVNQLETNPEGYRIHFTLFQAIMQGKESTASIIEALRHIERTLSETRFDLIVIIRGGGAQTDLDSFDDYDLAKAIAECMLPVVTGIGHERDESIADLVAHTRLKTPTAVASFLLVGFKSFEDRLNNALTRMERGCRNSLRQEERIHKDFDHRLRMIASNKLARQIETLARRASHITTHAKHVVQVQKLALQMVSKRSQQLAFGHLDKNTLMLGHLERQLVQLNPSTLLGKGYTRTEKAGKPIESQNIERGDQITTISLTKRITSTINEIHTYGKPGAI
jgi:exodeoxyribonuclease VII large subunit